MIQTRTVDLNRFKNAVGFTATFSCWGNSRKANLAKMRASADNADDNKAKARLKLSKVLIVSAEYEAIKSFLAELRAWVYTRTVPSFFKEGFQLCGLEGIADIERRFKKAIQVDLPTLVDNFLEAYPQQIEEARAALDPAGQFNRADYPGTDEMRRFFAINYNWVAFTVPDQLPPELRQQEQEKLERQFADAGEQIKTALRAGFAELIAHATERLTVQPGDKPKVFRDTLVGNISEFIETFNSRNLMNDIDLAQLVNKAKEVLQGVTPQKLRDDEGIKINVAQQFEAIKGTLSTMIVEKPSRKFELEEEPTAEPLAATEPAATEPRQFALV